MFASWFPGSDYQPVRTVGSGGGGGSGVSSSDSSPDEHTSLTIGRQHHQQQQGAMQAAPPSAVESVKASSKAAVNKVKGLLGLAEPVPPEEKTFVQEFDEMVSLTRTQRLYGFAITFALGWVISLMSLISLSQIATHPEKFAVIYTFGNIMSLCSTAFLWGPCQQLKDMFKPIRAVATLVYLLSMFLTLFCAFKLKMLIPTVFSIVIQFSAMVWYCITYIPYGQEMLKSCMGSCCTGLLG